MIENKWCPLAYFSRKLNLAQQKYSTFDRELRAIYLSIRHFCYFVEDRNFFIVTDHKPLTYAIPARSTNHSPRQARQLDYISQFTSDVLHLPGSANNAADAISCLDVADLSLALPIDLPTLAKAQRDENITTAVKGTSLVLQSVVIPTTVTWLQGVLVLMYPKRYDVSSAHNSMVFNILEFVPNNAW